MQCTFPPLSPSVSKLIFLDGKLPFPTEMRTGHMEGAINISYDKLLKDGISFKSKEDLHKCKFIVLDLTLIDQYFLWPFDTTG